MARAPRRPTSTGRKKVEIKRIESTEARQVCFSKRRRGLFSKASQLAVLCGVQVAVVAFSVGSKAFTFGHPSVDSVLRRFLPSDSSEEAQQATATATAASAEGAGADAGDRNLRVTLEELNKQHGEVSALLEAEKLAKEAAEEAFAKALADGHRAAVWLSSYLFEMVEEDLLAFRSALEKVRVAVEARTDQLRPAVPEAGPTSRYTAHGGGRFEVGSTRRGGFEVGGTSSGVETMDPDVMELMSQLGFAGPH